MNLSHLLAFLGIGILASYLAWGRSRVASLWLWLVLMLCPTGVVVWTLVVQQPLPTLWLVVTALICIWLYFVIMPEEVADPLVAFTESIDIPNPLPASILPAPVSKLTAAEENQLKGCFPWSVYYLQNMEYRPQGIICRGQLRYIGDRTSKQSPTEAAYNIIRTNIEANFSDRFTLLLQASTERTESSSDDAEDKVTYFFALVPNLASSYHDHSDKLHNQSFWRSEILLSVCLAVLTLCTILWVGVEESLQDLLPFSCSLSFTNCLNAVFHEFPTASFLAKLHKGLPFIVSVLVILTSREIARALVAKHHQIRLTSTYCIPYLGHLGTLGSLTWIKFPVIRRRILFDLAIAPSIAGLIVSLALLVGGLFLSAPVPLETLAVATNRASIFATGFSPFRLETSWLVSFLAQTVTWGRFHDAAIDMHPFAMAGWLGLVITALSLLPIGILEGGNLFHAIFGQRQAVVAGRISRLLLLMLALISQRWLLGVALALFLLSPQRQPVLDEVTDLSENSDRLGIMLLTIALAILLPIPKF